MRHQTLIRLPPLLYEFYRFLSWLFFLSTFPVFSLKTHWLRLGASSAGQRWGYTNIDNYSRTPGKHIWIHAASVGEVRAAKILIEHISKVVPDASFVLSTMTKQGKRVAQQIISNRIPCIFAPIDVPFAVKKTLAQIQPNLYICLETELWPNMIEMAFCQGVRLILANGRLSERSFSRYRFVRGLMQRILNRFSAISVIHNRDAERYIRLGARPEQLYINGNAKYDMVSSMDLGQVHAFRKSLRLNENQQVLIGGSTHTGEEEILLEVFTGLQHYLKDLILILAPRHLHRLPEVRKLLSIRGVAFDELSTANKIGRQHKVILVDSMGELASLYSIGTLIFCGGSMVNRGGHNIMEAAAWGKPVFYGPFMKDFADAADLLESVGAGISVHSAGELQQSMLQLVTDPNRHARLSVAARAVAHGQQGSASRQAELIKTLLIDMEQR